MGFRCMLKETSLRDSNDGTETGVVRRLYTTTDLNELKIFYVRIWIIYNVLELKKERIF